MWLAAQVSGCREHLSLLLLMEGGNTTCVMCQQDLLSLVAELKEEMERLRNIRDCEQETDWWTPCHTYEKGTGVLHSK